MPRLRPSPRCTASATTSTVRTAPDAAPPTWPASWLARLGSAWGVWLLGTAALLVVSGVLIGSSPGVDSVRAQIRATARSSLCFFLLAYSASAWQALRPGRLTQWLLKRRRQWGLLFATSHALHAGGIAALHALASAPLWAQLTSPAGWIIGGSGYLALLLLALSSSHAAVRWLGPARWQVLHRWGSHWLWLVFLLSCAKRVPGDPLYLVPVALLLGALLIRWRARLLKRHGPSL